MIGDRVTSLRTRRAGRAAALLALAAILPGCILDWNQRDCAEIGVSFLDWMSLPAAASGPQPFATRDGECYYAYKTEIRSLRDDSLVAECGQKNGFAGVLRAARVDGCDLACLIPSPTWGEEPGVAEVPRTLVGIDDASGAERVLWRGPQIVELSTAPQQDRLVLALATAAGQWEVYSVVATCDLRDGHECLRQTWEVRDMRGLDCTPDGDTFVCAGWVGGVQGVYIGLASTQAVPALLARNAQYPSISADGATVALAPFDPGRAWDRVRFHERASVVLLDVGSGDKREVEIGPNVLVCGTRYVENPTRLLVYGMRSDAAGREVWWVIWSIGSDGVARELREWKCGSGEVVL
jgi:hypothetical protein